MAKINKSKVTKKPAKAEKAAEVEKKTRAPKVELSKAELAEGRAAAEAAGIAIENERYVPEHFSDRARRALLRKEHGITKVADAEPVLAELLKDGISIWDARNAIGICSTSVRKLVLQMNAVKGEDGKYYTSKTAAAKGGAKPAE